MTGPRRIRWGWARRATGAAFVVLLISVGRGWFPYLQGSLTAATWFGALPLADPLAALEVHLASRDVQPTILTGAALLIGLTLLLGPVFCGWICPLGFLLDLNATLRRRVSKCIPRHRRLPDFASRSTSGTRYAVLGLVLGFAAVARWPLFQALSPINIVAWSFVFTAGPTLLVIALLCVVEQLSPRVWCRSVCPLGALYGWAGRFAPLRVRIHRGREGEAPCASCSRDCPMGIRVMEDYSLAGKTSVDHPACTRCGDCVDTCPGGVLYLGFRSFRSSDLPADSTEKS